MLDTRDKLNTATSNQVPRLAEIATRFAGHMALRLVHDHLLKVDLAKYDKIIRGTVSQINQKVKELQRVSPRALRLMTSGFGPRSPSGSVCPPPAAAASGLPQSPDGPVADFGLRLVQSGRSQPGGGHQEQRPGRHRDVPRDQRPHHDGKMGPEPGGAGGRPPLLTSSSTCRWSGTSCRPTCPPGRARSATSCWAPGRTRSRLCPTTSTPSGPTTPRPTPTCSATSLPWPPGPSRAALTR